MLGRGEKEVKIGDLSGYWLRIRLKDGRAGYAFGEFFNLDTFFSYDVPVFHGSAADPPARAELFGNGALFRAKRSRGAYGADAAVSGDEEIEFLADGSVRFSSSSSTLDGLSVTRYGGSWSSQSGWVMLRLEKGAEILKHGGSETAPKPVENKVCFLEWRSDSKGFPWSEDATKIESAGYGLNVGERRFERRIDREL